MTRIETIQNLKRNTLRFSLPLSLPAALPGLTDYSSYCSFNLATTVGSVNVVVSPKGRPSAISRNARRVISLLRFWAAPWRNGPGDRADFSTLLGQAGGQTNWLSRSLRSARCLLESLPSKPPLPCPEPSGGFARPHPGSPGSSHRRHRADWRSRQARDA